MKHFPVDTSDLEDISWSPDGRYIAVWDSLLEYKLLVYSPDGRLITSYSAYESGLGIKSVAWSPSGQFIAVGSFDEKVRLINNATWKPMMEFSHPGYLPFPDIDVFKESNGKEPSGKSGLLRAHPMGDARPQTHYILGRPPINVPTVRVEVDKTSPPKRGVGICEFSCDGRYIATRNDNMPTSLWVWDLLTLSQLALIVQTMPIKEICWNPLKPGLCAISCVNGHIYLWTCGSGSDGETEQGCSAIEIPAINFQTVSIKWTPDGRSIVLMDKDKFCLSFLVEG
ncbi:WD repeat-containing protein wrap73 [Entophlyctis luteolus]|nr:WD repeat-containing protein wrap73 [Entophlyctis luteolus]